MIVTRRTPLSEFTVHGGKSSICTRKSSSHLSCCLASPHGGDPNSRTLPMPSRRGSRWKESYADLIRRRRRSASTSVDTRSDYLAFASKHRHSRAGKESLVAGCYLSGSQSKTSCLKTKYSTSESNRRGKTSRRNRPDVTREPCRSTEVEQEQYLPQQYCQTPIAKSVGF